MGTPRKVGSLALLLMFCGMALADGAARTEYVLVPRATDPRFLESIVRLGPCPIKRQPRETDRIVVPGALYPRESVRLREEGTVRIRIFLDGEYCANRALILESSGFWRLDMVSIQYVMTLKFFPKFVANSIRSVDGQTYVDFPISWGASQDRRK